MNELHLIPHGARWALIPSDYPQGEPGTLAYRQQMIKWIAADPDRLQRHKSRPMKIKTTDTVEKVIKRLARIIGDQGIEYFSSERYLKEGESPAWPGAIYSEIGNRWVAVYPVTGSNEGVYIHIEVIGCKAEWNAPRLSRYAIGTVKVWSWKDAWRITKRCVELLAC